MRIQLPPVHVLLVLAPILMGLGCAPTQQWLQNRVCSCEVEQSCEEGSPAELMRAAAVQQVDYARQIASQDTAVPEQETGESEAREEDDDSAVRDIDELAAEVIDPSLPDARIPLDDEEKRKSFADRFGLQPPPEGRAYRGTFRDEDRFDLAVHRPGKSLDFYHDGDRFISLDLSDYAAVPIPEELSELDSGAVELVDKGTAQLQLIQGRKSDAGSIIYVVAIYKIIGDHVATIFERPVAKADSGGEIEQKGNLRYLHGVDHRIIEWIPTDAQGQQVDESIHYEWNPWEGVYRIPRPPPTAPRQPQSGRFTDPSGFPA